MTSKDDKFVISGGGELGGEIAVVGAKNAALKALAASLILSGPSVIKNVPQIEDIQRLIDIIDDLGAEIKHEGHDYLIINPQIKKAILDPNLHQRTRSSILLAVPILLQHGEVEFAYPGGCVIGKRPIDFFLNGYRKFGINVEERKDGFKLFGRQLKPAKIVFSRVSVTGTEAMMMLASRVVGRSEIINAAMEPEVVALGEFLNSCGAKIAGLGTPRLIIDGVAGLSGGTFTTPPDRIEAGTFAILAAATNSPLTVTNIVPHHMEVFWELLKLANVQFELGPDSVKMIPSRHQLKAIPKDIITHEYPGFPTDLQAPMAVLMTQAQGQSLIFETIYEGRLFYVDLLNSMGADIFMADPHRVMITGPTILQGAKLTSPDIRAGIAMVIAGLIANGQTEIDNIYQIDRGYERIEQRLQSIGAKIERTKS
ncbi:MAG TPA: UDP-N-acetylglucosamine 1-carboxyvinyltransferase [Candidatus Doudnabacteria bacterium]|nr:UDP-N-acetylglucosamine 1-carboxyvinyltransferase [Candidatus Doudnabacteria bacterium]